MAGTNGRAIERAKVVGNLANRQFFFFFLSFRNLYRQNRRCDFEEIKE